MVTFKRLLELAGIKLNEHMSADNARKIFTYYGEKPSGDVHELQTQYHRLARSNHPDAGGTVDAMQEINAAYDVLKTAQNPDEEIRRANGSAYEDFSDPEYYQRRVKKVSGMEASSARVLAFDGSRFTYSINVECSPKGFDTAVEGIVQLNKQHYTKAVCVVYDRDPRTIVVIFDGRRFINRSFTMKGFGNDPTQDRNIIAEIINLI